MSSNRVYGAKQIFSLLSQIMIGVYLFAIAALVIWAVHFLNVREDAMLEDLASAKRRMEQRKAAEERRRAAAADKETVQPDGQEEDTRQPDSALRQAELRKQKQMERARALPRKKEKTEEKNDDSDESAATNTVAEKSIEKSDMVRTSTVEKVEGQLKQPADTDAEKQSVHSK